MFSWFPGLLLVLAAMVWFRWGGCGLRATVGLILYVLAGSLGCGLIVVACLMWFWLGCVVWLVCCLLFGLIVDCWIGVVYCLRSVSWVTVGLIASAVGCLLCGIALIGLSSSLGW